MAPPRKRTSRSRNTPQQRKKIETKLLPDDAASDETPQDAPESPESVPEAPGGPWPPQTEKKAPESPTAPSGPAREAEPKGVVVDSVAELADQFEDGWFAPEEDTWRRIHLPRSKNPTYMLVARAGSRVHQSLFPELLNRPADEPKIDRGVSKGSK